METLIQQATLSTSINVKEKEVKAPSTIWAQAEQMRFGLSPAILTIVVCISSIAAAFAILSGVSMLVLVGLPTAVFISCIIALAPMRIIFGMALLTILLDVMVFILH
jgi:hypothetical protein